MQATAKRADTEAEAEAKENAPSMTTHPAGAEPKDTAEAGAGARAERAGTPAEDTVEAGAGARVERAGTTNRQSASQTSENGAKKVTVKTCATEKREARKEETGEEKEAGATGNDSTEFGLVPGHLRRTKKQISIALLGRGATIATIK